MSCMMRCLKRHDSELSVRWKPVVIVQSAEPDLQYALITLYEICNGEAALDKCLSMMNELHLRTGKVNC